MTDDAFTAYWNKYTGAVWVEVEHDGSMIDVATEVFNKSVAYGVLVVNGFTVSKEVGLLGFKSTAWKRTREQGVSKIEVHLDRNTLAGISVANRSRIPHTTKEYPMSVEDIIPVTVVYPLPDGEPVSYPHCEIDELDSEGDLIIVGTQANRGAPGFEYVVWREGSFSRAETTRVKRTETDEAPIEVDRVDA